MEHLNTYYYEPKLMGPRKTRRDFGLPEDAHLYVCPQTLFKIHPEFDQLLAGILQGDPAGVVVFIEGMYRHWNGMLLERFCRSIPDAADRFLFLPRSNT